jgi:hypothetical protein
MMLYNFALNPGFAHTHAVKLCEPVLAKRQEIKKKKSSNVKQLLTQSFATQYWWMIMCLVGENVVLLGSFHFEL